MTGHFFVLVFRRVICIVLRVIVGLVRPTLLFFIFLFVFFGATLILRLHRFPANALHGIREECEQYGIHHLIFLVLEGWHARFAVVMLEDIFEFVLVRLGQLNRFKVLFCLRYLGLLRMPLRIILVIAKFVKFVPDVLDHVLVKIAIRVL